MGGNGTARIQAASGSKTCFNLKAAAQVRCEASPAMGPCRCRSPGNLHNGRRQLGNGPGCIPMTNAMVKTMKRRIVSQIIGGLTAIGVLGTFGASQAAGQEEKKPAETKPAATEPPTKPTPPPDPKQTPIDGLKEVKTESGLKYWDIKVGDGPSPKPEHKITVHYSGWFTNGELFDSSVKRGSPSTLRLNQFIKGWIEGVGSMKAGGKRRLEVPGNLAYGEKGRGSIPPNATLIFEVELLNVHLPPAQTSVEGITPVVAPHGLKYWDIKVGDGASPSETSVVTVHYSGWLTDGTLFDSSVDRGVPAKFVLNQTTRGLTEGIASMKVGGKRRLEIPHELAYGDQGRPPSIPPKATLIYEVELIKAD